MREVEEICRRHSTLDAAALAELAPIAADGHAAYLVLYIAEHAAAWRAKRATPPLFVTRSKHAAAASDWAEAQRQAADPHTRAALHARHRAGEAATVHLLRLAEPFIRWVVRPLTVRAHNHTTVADLADMLNTARSAVTQGIWAYDPAKRSGPHYLRAWIEEHVRREMAGLTYQVSLPGRTQQRFIRIAAIRADLAEKLGREPTDAELLARHDAAFTQHDLDDERATRHRRLRTGLGLDPLPLDNDIPRVPVHAATQDRADPDPGDLDSHVAERADATGSAATAGWLAALQLLQLGDEQIAIMAQHAGLPPDDALAEKERSERAIARRLGLSRSTVRDVLIAIRLQMATPGGRLHHLLDQLSAEDREGLGLQRFAQMLGPLPPDAPPPAPMPTLLTAALPRNNPPPAPPPVSTRSGLLIRYECPQPECGWSAYEHFPAARFVLEQLRCPRCGSTARPTAYQTIPPAQALPAPADEQNSTRHRPPE